jgi:hypothetical protein
MSYYMRYIFTDPAAPDLNALETVLTTADPAFNLLIDPAASNIADVFYSDDAYGVLEINQPGGDIFEEDIEDLTEAVSYHDDPRKDIVLRTLKAATGLVALQVTEAGHAYLERFDPLWDWLFERYNGLLQVDEQGFFDAHERILTLLE